MLYFAYGSNLSHEQMKERCKNSKYIYRINWGRFGSVSMDKWVGQYNDEDGNCVLINGSWIPRA